MKPDVLCIIPIDHLPEVQEKLKQSTALTTEPFPIKERLLEIIGEYQGLIPNLSLILDKDILAAATNLKVIATPSTGTDHIDLNAANKLGIEVQSLKHDYDVLKNITSTAENAFLLMLATLRKLPFAFDAVRNDSWDNQPFRGREAQGRVLGILGYGRLGKIVSRYAKGFDMQVIAHDPNKTITDNWVEQVSFDELLARAEIISIHIHLTPETRNLISTPEFEKMRDGIYIVNTSRGSIIDEEAFLAALGIGKVAGAGIDVLTHELDGNIADIPLVQYAKTHDNLIITPHIGGVTIDAQQKAFMHTATKLIDFLKQKPS